ncbi:hypothetical protein CHS0354_031124 [Potamilus streckersoni]|uniref:Uncharacterized protein n=1 Tax=Potamilus streckersoni TaxID=2493646 RepID=A0AAE0TCP3_9BIVA|nr:hypothetical protein CHS0354_031124 [Potamilus streckersoni]
MIFNILKKPLRRQEKRTYRHTDRLRTGGGEIRLKRVAVKKVQHFLDTWRTQLSRYIKPSFTSTEKCVGNPYLDAFVRVLGVKAHDAIEALFECNRRIFTTLQVNRNTDIGVDLKQVLGFEPKVKSMTQKASDRESYLNK